MNWIEKMKYRSNLKKTEKKWGKYLEGVAPGVKEPICSWLGSEDYVYDDSLVEMLWEFSVENHMKESVGVHRTTDSFAKKIMAEGILMTGHNSSGIGT